MNEVKFIKNKNIFHSNAQALVNPVNCRGVMGKGLASQFKHHFPSYYEHYLKLCNLGEIRLGHVHVYSEPDIALSMYQVHGLEDEFDISRLPTNYIIISFPTKNHWKEQSEYRHIARGLRDLNHQISHWGIESVAIPKLGCGLGGLKWSVVKEQIVSELDNSLSNDSDKKKDVTIEIYE